MSNAALGPGNMETLAQNQYLTNESSSDSNRIFRLAHMKQISV